VLPVGGPDASGESPRREDSPGAQGDGGDVDVPVPLPDDSSSAGGSAVGAKHPSEAIAGYPGRHPSDRQRERVGRRARSGRSGHAGQGDDRAGSLTGQDLRLPPRWKED
jgi:hypothetical protein